MIVEKEKRAQTLAAAVEAFENGTASEAQAAIVIDEREKAAAAEAKKNRKWSDALFGGFQKDEKRGGTLGAAVLAGQEHDTPLSVVDAVEEKIEQSKPFQRERSVKGGQLDQLGENVAQVATDGTKGWISWTRGR